MDGLSGSLGAPHRLPSVLLPGGLRDGGMQPQRAGGFGRVLARCSGSVQDAVGPGGGFLAEAAGLPVRTHTEVFPMAEANRALRALKGDAIRGAAVLSAAP